MAAYGFSIVLQLNKVLPLGRSCFQFGEFHEIFPDQVFPGRPIIMAIQPSICGFFQNVRLDFDISYGDGRALLSLFNNNTLFENEETNWSNISLSDNDAIQWSKKPYFMWGYHLPKIVWKNNHEVDVYIKNPVRYGEEIVTLDGTYGDKTDQAIIRFHYVLEN